MHYRKFKADFIFDGKEILSEDKVLVTNEAGVIEAIINETEAGGDIQKFEGLLSPGFINCHCHLELSHMKNVIGTGTGLVDFLISVVGKRGFEKEIITDAIIAADAEMYENGIVAVGDICNTIDTIPIKLKSKINYSNFIETIGFTEMKALEIFEKSQQLYNDFVTAGLRNTYVVPHAPYTISEAMFKLINDFSAGKIVSIHNQETSAEDELYRKNAGDFFRLYHHLNINTKFFQAHNKSSLQSYLPLLNKTKSLLLIHNTFTTQSDIEFAVEQSKTNKQDLFWCFCPNANLYIEDKLPDIKLFSDNNCNIILGTDSYSSNYSLSLLDEMKTLQKHFPFLETERLLQWATLNGSAALGVYNHSGSFEKGKKPGIVLINNIQHKNFSEASAAKRIL
ncbi:amidohydrolase family protein [Parafilimonas terrae]|uniref:Cytosine/adenosine deaminase n=1 Tax=Parafilimonas terrae TaxID=1465490 RepID=A0A1I5X8D5_9BACT|nr:amidohydrolase family protein [Parafilimonas terrae]SFQ28240.1 Cytosine/adenosine deaminase [Parafilimonas terrae]